MARRRLIGFVALLALLALVTTWQALSGHMSRAEQGVVGAWQHFNHVTGELRYTAVFAPDGRYWPEPADSPEAPSPAGRWAVRGDCRCFDFDPSEVRRKLRPVARLVGLRTGAVEAYPIEITPGRLDFVFPDGSRHVL